MVPLLFAAVLFATATGSDPSPKPGDPELLFAVRVWPLLKDRCLPCHGEGTNDIKGGLELGTRPGLLRGGDSGAPAIIPGKSGESPLLRAIARDDDEFSPMPPKVNDRLTPDEISAFREWIDGEAPWPTPERIRAIQESNRPRGVRVPTSGGLSRDWTDRVYEPENLWAYQPLRKPSVPAAEGAAGPIDGFLDARLHELGLAAAPPCDRRALIRRASFDVTGLPPRPIEIDDFVNDPSPDDVAFTRVVDRLLASPHFGEQVARHWLDVARYADSSGLANDYERGNAWRYRDFVVRCFNSDLPYDQFIRAQIAGDEIAPDDPEMLIAVGFLRMGPWELTGMEVPRVARQRFLDDVTDAVGEVFLGQMLQCARCHDHKFDPIPTRDFYRMQAIFATTQLSERPAPFLDDENRSGFGERSYLDRRRQAFEADLARIKTLEDEARSKWIAAHGDSLGRKPPRPELLSPTDLGLERIGRKGLERLKWEEDRYEPIAFSVYNGRTPSLKAVLAPFRPPADREAGSLDATAILAGGDPFGPTEPVSPGVLSVLGSAPIPDRRGGRRLALANWVADPSNPLTPRVMANRIWQWTMGRPIAGNPNNFGATGKKPTHPMLLDWLAAEFVSGGWSVKSLMRQILRSNAYRRSSRLADLDALARLDPEGHFFAAFPPRRLSAEEIRDAMLMATGELNREIGGIPIRPEIHPDVAFQPRQVMGTFAAAWEPSPLPFRRHRRTLYALKPRGVRDPFQEVFNAPGTDLSCEAREVSTVAPQALALLNGESTRARALALAARVLGESSSAEDAVTLAFRRALGRHPTEAERDACLSHWDAMTRRHENLQSVRPGRPRSILREAVEENTGERFTYREILTTADDFVADLHPADVPPRVRGLMEVCLVILNTNEFLHVD